ncbi:acyltransferase family protein [Streptomyces cucumeris]|uniref:acyltransferase family protein n=1 Tax=Streptomyces cucumeris TaxID=2962890 RepID=UPI003D70BC26
MTLLLGRPQTTPPATAGGGRLPSLTGMRWAAAFLVFIFHVTRFDYFGGGFGLVVDGILGGGGVGVSFFFILSGFVLAWSFREDERALTFWRRRIARVYPVHLVTAAMALALAFTLVPGLRPSGIPEAVANLLLVSSWKEQWWQALNPVSWSLTCEAFFYAAFPAIFALLRRLRPRLLTTLTMASTAAVILIPCANLTFALGWSPHFPLVRLPEFVVGAAACRLVQLGAWRGPGLGTSAALSLTGYILMWPLPSAFCYAACTVIGLVCLISAAAVADLNGTPTRWRHPRLVRLGEWSFAFYMIHILVMRTGEQLFTVSPRLGIVPGLAVTTAAFLVSLGLAWALYVVVEQRCRQWILRGIRRPRRPRLSSSAEH